MKTYKILLRTKYGTDIFIINEDNLNAAIEIAKKQLPRGVRVLQSTGYVID